LVSLSHVRLWSRKGQKRWSGKKGKKEAKEKVKGRGDRFTYLPQATCISRDITLVALGTKLGSKEP
jgi:hypothetical protein